MAESGADHGLAGQVTPASGGQVRVCDHGGVACSPMSGAPPAGSAAPAPTHVPQRVEVAGA